MLGYSVLYGVCALAANIWAGHPARTGYVGALVCVLSVGIVGLAYGV